MITGARRGNQMEVDWLENMLIDIRNEPDWRAESNRAADYYDGNQLDAEALDLYQARGMQPSIRNLIAPAIDVVLGTEAKNRQDFKVLADEDSDSDVALGLNKQVNEAERLSAADKACSDALKGQLVAGVGWVEVGDETNPFKYQHKVRSVHRREVWWDWRATEDDLSDARYLVRRRWFDPDVLATHFPQHKAMIEQAQSGWASWDQGVFGDDGIVLGRAFAAEHRASIEELEWRDLDRRRLALYEVRYRVWSRGKVLRLPDGQVMEFDRKDPRHAMAAQSGIVRVEEWPLTKIRHAFWLGPHKLVDLPSPYQHGHFGIVPFWGVREDRTGVPYGLVRRMMPVQDEVNARLSKLYWLLSAKRVIADDDAFAMPLSQVRHEVGRPDAMILTDPGRANRASPIKIETDRELSAQQYSVLNDAMAHVPELGGVYRPQMGKDSDVKSGVAIAGLVEQGATTLAEIMDNWRYSRKLVGELLLSNIVQQQGNTPLEVEIARGREKTMVAFNMPAKDGGMTNALARIKTRVELTETPQTPTYRAQRLSQLMEIVQSLPEDLQRIVLPMVIRGMDFPDREEIATAIEEAVGRGDKSPIQVLAEQREQAFADQQQQQVLGEQRAKIDKTAAETEKLKAQVQEILSGLERQSVEMADRFDQVLGAVQGGPAAIARQS